MLTILAMGFALWVAPTPTTTPSLVTALPVPLTEQVGLGRAIATQNCQSCHAIGSSGVSPIAAAPQFRYLSRRYPVDNLSEAFAEGILIGHSVMPEFQFAPNQIDGLIAYLKSVQARVPVKRKKRSHH